MCKSVLFFISKNDPKTLFFVVLCMEYIKKDEIIAAHLSHSATAVNQNFFKRAKLKTGGFTRNNTATRKTAASND